MGPKHCTHRNVSGGRHFGRNRSRLAARNLRSSRLLRRRVCDRRHYGQLHLPRAGWNAEERGLFGAPELKVIVGGDVHVSLLKALSMLGLGRSRVTIVPADNQGRMRADSLPILDDRTIVCIQAGNVNTGAFDPAAKICPRAREAGAWVHVDGAFGLWTAAVPQRAHLLSGFFETDSWATDCHKWLNVPYDSGMAF